MSPDPALESTLAALQATLAAEHAAIFVYGDVGAHTSQSADPDLFARVTDLYRAHRARRDRLRLLIADHGARPVAAEATYDLPRAVGTPASVRTRALELERRFTEVYAALVANTVAADRGWAVDALGEAAQAAIVLGGEPEAFPGAPELA